MTIVTPLLLLSTLTSVFSTDMKLIDDLKSMDFNVCDMKFDPGPCKGRTHNHEDLYNLETVKAWRMWWLLRMENVCLRYTAAVEEMETGLKFVYREKLFSIFF